MTCFENENQSYYDILDLRPDASPQEIREAYLRTKTAFNKDSVAIYTLIDPNERDETVGRVEEAYAILSHPEKRKEYDRRHGYLGAKDLLLDSMPAPAPNSRKIISIDRVPPMESHLSEEEVLVAPKTDFPPETGHPNRQVTVGTEDAADPGSLQMKRRSAEETLLEQVASEVEWSGQAFRRIREARRLSVEEVTGITKISKNYLNAIENETFESLPAAVFVRGFIVQLCRTLRIPPEKATHCYMARFYKGRPDQQC